MKFGNIRIIGLALILSMAGEYISGANAPETPLVTSLDNAERAAMIRRHPDYIYGEGRGASFDEADREALRDILSKIGMNVSSKFTLQESETESNGKYDSSSSMESAIDTYSQATLNNTETIKLQEGSSCYFMRFMKRDELLKMFAERRDRVEDYVRTACRAEEKGKVNEALRLLNWAYVLLHSLQYPGEVKMKIDGEDRLLINWIPKQMESILNDISVGVAAVNDDNSVDLTFNYKGKPAAGVDFTYWNGGSNSPLQSARDGIAKIEFPAKYPIQQVSLAIETSYEESSQTDKELRMMIEQFTPLNFGNSARRSVGTEGKALKADKTAVRELNSIVTAEKKNGLAMMDKKDFDSYRKVMKEVVNSIKTKNYNPDASLFTDEGLDMYRKLLSYGKASIIGVPDPGYFQYGDKVVARSIPMKFSFGNNTRSFTEDVTFTFNPEGKIECVAFGLGSAARDDIFAQGDETWTDEVKMTIATFLENYKTAFALKRLDYIESIFDDNAYIIVGHKLRKLNKIQGEYNGFSTSDEYEYSRKSKEEYMKNLKQCFASNEYININFSNNDVMKAARGGDVFGIQIKQDYHSQHYGDQGYLYLFVDLNDKDMPIIKIRTWQPERNPALTPNVSKNNPDFGIFGNYSFQ